MRAQLPSLSFGKCDCLPFSRRIKSHPSQGEGLQVRSLTTTPTSWALSLFILSETCPHCRPAPRGASPFPGAHGSGTAEDPTALLWGLRLSGEIPSRSGFPYGSAGLTLQLPKGGITPHCRGACNALPSIPLQEHVSALLLNPKLKAT